MTIDVVICTYNRPEKIKGLIDQLSSSFLRSSIIIVDSSEFENKELSKDQNLIYIHSIHKNQPFQRYLGFSISKNEYVMFLDDDMEVVNTEFLGKITEILECEKAVGLALNFRDKHHDTTLEAIPKSTLFNRSKLLKQFKNWFTGNADLPQGTLGLCGIRGSQPDQIAPTQYVSGGAFVGKRSELFQNFNLQLFDLFEQRMGMGEDALIGYALHKRGKLIYDPEVYFVHNDQKDSTYSMNMADYAQRVLFSRLYLSLEKSRLDNNSLFTAKMHYHWYACWRIIGLFLNWILKPNRKRKEMLLGSWKGWVKSWNFRFHTNLNRNAFWENEIGKNLEGEKLRCINP